MKRRNDLLALVAVVLVLLGTALITSRAPESDAYVDTFSSHDADVGGYLAFYRLLERSGRHVERFERPSEELDTRIRTLIVANNGSFYVRDVPNVERFVRAGGNLVWVSEGPDEADPAWKPLHFPRFTNVPKAIARGRQCALYPAASLRGVRRIALASDRYERLQTNAFPPAVPLFGDRGGAIVARYRLGRGIVTIVTDPTIFANRSLARDDNARLALALVPRGGLVSFEETIHGFGSHKGAWNVFPAPMQLAVILAIAVAVLAWIGANLRVIPLVALAPPSDANASLYIASLGALLRRGHATSRAANDLVTSTFAACARALGLTRAAGERELIAAYGGRGEAMRAEMIRDVARLRERVPLDEGELVRVAALCHALREGARRSR